MKKLSLSFFLLLFFFSCFSQGFISKKKYKLKNRFDNLTDTSSQKPILKETDSTLSFIYFDKSIQTSETVYTFDNRKRCVIENYTFNCDSCFNKALKSSLSFKYLKWHKINDYLYVSKPFWRTILKINQLIPFSYSISAEEISRELYKSGSSLKILVPNDTLK